MPGFKIDSLNIEGFRAFRSLKIPALGQINLITGGNNTGKSSLLECLHILASDANPSILHNILTYREENKEEGDNEFTGIQYLVRLCTLFSSFPEISEAPESIPDPIVLSAERSPHNMKLSMRIGWASPKYSSDGSMRLAFAENALSDELESGLVPVLRIEANERSRLYCLQDFSRFHLRDSEREEFQVSHAGKARVPCLAVGSSVGGRTSIWGNLWDRIALSNAEKHVIEGLQLIEPAISAVSMVGDQSAGGRAAIVRSDRIGRPVPLRTFGNGLSRLFGMLLFLVNASGGLLLIEEFENGIHHSVQIEVWKMIFRLAQKLEIQVFATTHSWDAIEAFQRAASASQAKGSLVRLVRRDDQIIATVFSEDELAVVTRSKIEVR